MKIQIEPHTLQRAEERGTNIEEIQIVLEQGMEIPARGNRKAKAKVFTFERGRRKHYYYRDRVRLLRRMERLICKLFTIQNLIFYTFVLMN